jgi:hypothetical protein
MYLIQHSTYFSKLSLVISQEQEIKSKHFEKEEVRLSLFTNDITSYNENSMKSAIKHC